MPDLVSSFVQGYYNDRAQERSFQQQKELQKDAQAYNTLMFNAANAYNSPEAQMQRFQSAGLNPNLIYGQLNNSASAPSIGSSSAPSPAQMQAPSLLETAQIGLINAQKANIEADTSLKESGVTLNDATVEKYGHENNWTDQQIEESKSRVNQINKDIEVMDSRITEIQAGINLMKSQQHLTDEQALGQWIDNIWADRRNQAVINHLKSQTRLNDAQAKELLTLLAAKQYNIQCNSAYLGAMTKRLNEVLPHEVKQFMNSEKAFSLGLPQMEAESNLADHQGWYYGLKYGTQIVGSAVQLLTPASIYASGRMNSKAAAAARDSRAANYIATGDSYNWMSSY